LRKKGGVGGGIGGAKINFGGTYLPNLKLSPKKEQNNARIAFIPSETILPLSTHQ